MSHYLGLTALVGGKLVGYESSGDGVSKLMYYEAVCGASLVLHHILAFP